MSCFELSAHVFDAMQYFWHKQRTKIFLSTCLITIFISGLILIQLRRWELLNFLSPALLHCIPINHFYAVHLAFTMLLFLEVMDLIFVLPSSMSRAIATQLEILALILLRNAFKELTHLHEPVSFALDAGVIPRIIACSTAALLVFIALGIYKKMPHFKNIMKPESVMQYVIAKKNISLALILCVIFLLTQNMHVAWMNIHQNVHEPIVNTAKTQFFFFDSMYTILIFADILLVLLSQKYLPSFQALFRNSGYVVATLLMRISFAAPVYLSALIGVGSAVYALALTWAVHFFYMHQAKPPQNA